MNKNELSNEAIEYLKSNKPLQYSNKIVTSLEMEKIRKRRALLKNPVLDEYKSKYEIKIAHETIENIPVLTYLPKEANIGKFGFSIHGGAFVMGSPYNYDCLVLAQELKIKIISIDYQLCPEVQYPVSFNECFKVYQKISKLHKKQNLIAFGDSAGGNLLLSTLLKANQQKIRLPEAICLFSPWSDLSGKGDSYEFNKNRDPTIIWENQLAKYVNVYIGESDRNDPFISPLYGNYTEKFPPTLITCGTRDLFLSDCVSLFWTMKNADINVDLKIWEGMWHVFQSIPKLPEGERCYREVTAFFKKFINH